MLRRWRRSLGLSQPEARYWLLQVARWCLGDVARALSPRQYQRVEARWADNDD